MPSHAEEEILLRDFGVQTGWFGPIVNGGIMEHTAIRNPYGACLIQLENRRQRPAISNFEDVTSKLKRCFCTELLRIVKEQARHDLLSKKIDVQLYARVYGVCINLGI